jgi:hypothetical protein
VGYNVCKINATRINRRRYRETKEKKNKRRDENIFRKKEEE